MRRADSRTPETIPLGTVHIDPRKASLVRPDGKSVALTAREINGNEIMGNWEMYKLPMSSMPDFTKMKSVKNGSSQAKRLAGCPVLYEGTFTLDKTGDTFIDMGAWGKGIVFVNGHNLGRYWQVGPQQTLYLPGVWLNEGENKIVIFEQLNEKEQSEIKTVKTPVLTDLR